MELCLKGKRAIVLASSKGLGRASAKELVREGARVVISSRSEENLEAATDAILDDTDADPNQVIPITCDLSNPDAIPSQLQAGIDELSGLDILVTNRGGPPEQSFEESTIDDFDSIYTSVLKSTIVAVKTTLSHLLEDQNGGVITNIVATSSQEPTSHHILANSIRPGVYGFSKSLSSEYGRENLRVNCVTPRGIWTERAERRQEKFGNRDEDLSTEEAREKNIERLALSTADHALARYADPAEFGRVVAFVSSDAAGYITGEVIDVDGGWSRQLM
jgi:3-oxoacyl-[acyl-carrier protein] reductase